MKGQYYRWRWERIVEDYNGKPLTKNDKQYDKWEHELADLVLKLPSLSNLIMAYI